MVNALNKSNTVTLPINDSHPDGGKREPVIVINGFLVPAGRLTRLIRSIEEGGYEVHAIGENNILGVEKRLDYLTKQLTDQTGKSISIVGYSLGGTFAVWEQQKNPCEVEKAIAIASHVSPVIPIFPFAILKSEGEKNETVSIYNLWDRTVPWWFSYNPSFDRNHAIPDFPLTIFENPHDTIVNKKKVLEIVNKELRSIKFQGRSVN